MSHFIVGGVLQEGGNITWRVSDLWKINEVTYRGCWCRFKLHILWF